MSTADSANNASSVPTAANAGNDIPTVSNDVQSPELDNNAKDIVNAFIQSLHDGSPDASSYAGSVMGDGNGMNQQFNAGTYNQPQLAHQAPSAAVAPAASSNIADNTFITLFKYQKDMAIALSRQARPAPVQRRNGWNARGRGRFNSHGGVRGRRHPNLHLNNPAANANAANANNANAANAAAGPPPPTYTANANGNANATAEGSNNGQGAAGGAGPHIAN